MKRTCFKVLSGHWKNTVPLSAELVFLFPCWILTRGHLQPLKAAVHPLHMGFSIFKVINDSLNILCALYH